MIIHYVSTNMGLKLKLYTYSLLAPVYTVSTVLQGGQVYVLCMEALPSKYCRVNKNLGRLAYR